MTIKLKNMVDTLKTCCEFEIVEDKGKELILKYEQYNLLYCLKENDFAFIIAIMIIDGIETSDLIESCNQEVTLFSGGDILALREAINADKTKLWNKYFYSKFEYEIFSAKQDVLDYIKFIKRIYPLQIDIED